jgi:dihydropteroate synthase
MSLRLRDGSLELEPGRPQLMGIVNATPDSFSDRQGVKSVDELHQRALDMRRDGVTLVDVGGESGRTDRAAVSADEEASRVVPVIERLVADGFWVSVDTWREAVARAALDVGAVLINDVSGLSDPGIATACAETGAGLVITHTRVAPKTKDFPEYDDVVGDVVAFLGEQAGVARAAGVEADQLLLDPGFDLGKAPTESIEILRRLPEVAQLGRPLLLAISRKDFIGAATQRPPADRDAGTLGAIEPAFDCGVGALLRVHDVAAASDFLHVRHVVRKEMDLAEPLAEDLMRERA